MNVLELLQDSDCHFDSSILGKRLGDGADGEVFELISDSKKVIKFSIIYDLGYESNLVTKYNEIKKKLSFVKENGTRCQHLCSIYNFGLLLHKSRKTSCGAQEFLIHFYEMEKLIKCSDEEEKVFYTIISNAYRSIEDFLDSLSKWIDFDRQKVLTFVNANSNSVILHNDIHLSNIMKNENGDFKLIDLDRITILKQEN